MSGVVRIRPTVTLIAILKGGARKSTTAMLTAFGLARLGEDVLVIDADAGTQGVTDWASRVWAAHPDRGLPFHVSQWSPRSCGILVPWARKQIEICDPSPGHVLVDVGGEAPEVVEQAALIADRVIAPLAPEHAEIGRLGPTRDLLHRVRPGLPLAVLLTRVPAVGAGASRELREVLTVDGYTVLPMETSTNRERYAHVWGTEPGDLGAYGELAELLRDSVPAVAIT